MITLKYKNIKTSVIKKLYINTLLSQVYNLLIYFGAFCIMELLI